MPTITLYTKPNCPLCDHTRHYLQQVIAERPDASAWVVDEISILDDQDLYTAYRYVIPVVVVDNGTPIPAPASMDVAYLRAALRSAQVAASVPTTAMPLPGPGAAPVETVPDLAPAAAAPPVPADGSTAAGAAASDYPNPYSNVPPRPQTVDFVQKERIGYN
jgi:glutaredoxin